MLLSLQAANISRFKVIHLKLSKGHRGISVIAG
jgi:hypothetical protein